MFKNLFNFGYRRNTKEAFGFYIAYLILVVALGVLSTGLLVAAMGVPEEEGYEFGVKVGGIVAVIVCTVTAFLILKAKKLLSRFEYVLLGILAGIVALFLGALGGLIPVAYLSTREALL